MEKEIRDASGSFHGANLHTHTSIHGLLNQALITERLPVTIWKNFRRNRRARFGGLGSVLSVPWKSASLGSDSGGLPKAVVPSVATVVTWVGGVGGLWSRDAGCCWG